jgi:DnaJ-class molecular chaperone
MNDFEDAIEEPEEDEDEICSWCNGCGEGMYDGAACGKCKGTGVEPVERDDDI